MFPTLQWLKREDGQAHSGALQQKKQASANHLWMPDSLLLHCSISAAAYPSVREPVAASDPVLPPSKPGSLLFLKLDLLDKIKCNRVARKIGCLRNFFLLEVFTPPPKKKKTHPIIHPAFPNMFHSPYRTLNGAWCQCILDYEEPSFAPQKM